MFSNKSLLIGVATSVVLLVLVGFFSEAKLISLVFLLCGLLGTFFLLKKQNTISLSIWDCALLLLVGIEVFVFIFSVNPLYSYSVLAGNLVAIEFFFLSKFLFKKEKNTILFLQIGMFFILGICIFSVYSFWILKNTLYSVEWFSVYDFRHLHRPFGLISNVWYSFLLIFIPFVLFCYYHFQKHKNVCYITLIFIVLNLLISFSRSVYLILILIVCVSFIQFIFTRKNGKILSCLLLPIISFYVIFKNDCDKTLSFNTSVSQQRSISARVHSTENAIHLLKNNFIGYGQGSYSLINSERFENVDIPFTSFAPNILAQLFVEKGIFGAIIWCVSFSLLMFFILRKSYKNPDKSLFFTALLFFITFSLRELSFSVFQESIYFQILFYIFISFLLFYSNLNTFFEKKISSKHLFLFLLGLVFVLFSSIFLQNDEISIEKQIRLGTTHWNSYQKQKYKTDLDLAKKYFQKAEQNNPYDIRLKFFNAITEYEIGNKAQGISRMEYLLEKYPNNPLYSFSLFSVYHKEDNQKWKYYLIKTIELSPKIVDTEFFKTFLYQNPQIYDDLKSIFYEKCIKNTSENPFELGKQGKILFFFGFEKEAQRKLHKASELYPALSYVWLNLYKITQKEVYFKRFILLEYGSYFVANKDKYSTDFFIPKIDIDFLQNSYIPKYRNWYLKNPSNFIIH